jgi:hypothetical protein
LVFDFRNRSVQVVDPNWQMGRSRQDFTTESLLAIAGIFDELKVNGCVTVSVIDAVRSKVMLDRSPLLTPPTILGALKERRNTQKVDAHILMARQQAGTFLRNYLQTVVNDHTGCHDASPPIDRIIVLLSDALLLPESNQLTPLTPSTNAPATRFYFFRMTVVDYLRRDSGRAYLNSAIRPDDQVASLLKDLGVRRFDLSQPKDFQKAWPRFLEDLKAFGNAPP